MFETENGLRETPSSLDFVQILIRNDVKIFLETDLYLKLQKKQAKSPSSNKYPIPPNFMY